jgi:hypothetical protein
MTLSAADRILHLPVMDYRPDEEPYSSAAITTLQPLYCYELDGQPEPRADKDAHWWTDATERLKEIATLGPTEEFVPPDLRAVVQTGIALRMLAAESGPVARPGIFPDEEGGVSLEWLTPHGHVEIHFLPGGKVACSRVDAAGRLHTPRHGVSDTDTAQAIAWVVSSVR